MTSLINAEIADHRHAELMAEAEMLRRARLARARRRAELAARADGVDVTDDVRQAAGRAPRRVGALRLPLGAVRSWLVAGQL